MTRPIQKAVEYPPERTLTLAEWNEEYPPAREERPDYRLVCTACEFEHAGTVNARQRPWFLVTWICYGCRSKGGVD